MKRALAALITAVILFVVLWMSVGESDQQNDDSVVSEVDNRVSRPTAVDPAGPAPEQCIQRMFDAAEQGDLAGYVDCFAGAERDQLDRQLNVQSRDEFAEALIEAIRQLKGHAVHQAKIEDNEAEVVVERVYSSRNERQRYELVKERGIWRITTVHPVEPFQPEIPYGTPIYEEPADR